MRRGSGRSSTTTPGGRSEAPSRPRIWTHVPGRSFFGGVSTWPTSERRPSGRRNAGAAPAPVEFRYTQTDSFVALLQQLGASLVVSTYQANKLLVAQAAGGGLLMLVHTFERPMGLAVDARRLVIGTRKEVWFLRNAPDKRVLD